jgi:hypothetical protein
MLSSLLAVLPLAGLLLLPLAIGSLLYRRGDRTGLRAAARAFLLGVLVALVILSPFAVWEGWCRSAPRGDVAAADSFVVFSFGLGPTVNGQPTAGASNRALAQWLVDNNPDKTAASKPGPKLRKPAVVQEGVYLALKELEQEQKELKPTEPLLLESWDVIRLPEREGFYVDTLAAAYQADALLARNGLSKPVLVSHDLQLCRMVQTFAGIGTTDVVVPEMPPVSFDPESVQHWGTRYKPVWLLREAFAARPLTLAPHTTAGLLAFAALLYGIAIGRVTK